MPRINSVASFHNATQSSLTTMHLSIWKLILPVIKEEILAKKKKKCNSKWGNESTNPTPQKSIILRTQDIEDKCLGTTRRIKSVIYTVLPWINTYLKCIQTFTIFNKVMTFLFWGKIASNQLVMQLKCLCLKCWTHNIKLSSEASNLLSHWLNLQPELSCQLIFLNIMCWEKGRVSLKPHLGSLKMFSGHVSFIPRKTMADKRFQQFNILSW